MRRSDPPITPEVERELDAIDAALAGEPVDPALAEIAELTVLLAGDAPRPDRSFAALLDERVAERFATSGPAIARSSRKWQRLGALIDRPRAIPALAGAATLLLVVGVAATELGRSGSPAPPGRIAFSTPPSTVTPDLGVSPARSPKAAAPQPTAGAAAPSSGAIQDQAAGGGVGAQNQSFNALDGRKVEQRATLDLGAPADRLDDVAQGVIGVVSREGGIVDRSSVSTATDGGGAQFELRFPSDRLATALAQLSRLQHAQVRSRSDDTVDINASFVSTTRRLADARAERSGLLRSLASATTAAETARLRTRLDATEATIASTEQTLRALNRRVDFSHVTLTIEATAPTSGSHAFTLHRALHDAKQILTVAGGVALVTLAALVPLSLLGALAWALAGGARRRRRERALDAI
jgi:Domain of unknown function (DUF4349)